MLLCEQAPWQPTATGGETLNLADPWRTCQTVHYDAVPIPFNYDPAAYKYPGRMSSTYGFDPNFRTPYTVQSNLSVEREVLKGFSVQAGYVANRGVRLRQSVPLNYALWASNASLSNVNNRRPLAAYSGISYYSTRQRSYYDSLQLAATLRLGAFTSRLTYVASKTMGLGSIINPFNFNQYRGPSAAGQTFRYYYSYSLPFGRGSKKTWVRLAGNWQLTGSVSASTGPRGTVGIGSDWNYDGISGDRPDLIAPIAYTTRNKDNRAAGYFSKASFANPAIRNTYGSEGTGVLRLPGSWNTDIAVLKNFPVTERLRGQFRAEAYDLFNHNNLDNPNTTMSSSDFTRILTRSGNRTMQLGVRFSF
jgi:hypothetical protein